MPQPQVVKIFATCRTPDYVNPWQAQAPVSVTGSGVIIGPQRVITGAHVVANATFIQVQKISDPDKIVARVEAVCHDSDLALLHIDEPDFAAGIEPAEIGELPSLRDKVSAMGFPIGGDEVSVTEGVVSRIEVQCYDHSQRNLLAVTIDAAINEGNSGGPVFKDQKVVGIAFQKLEGAENASEMVPASMIRRFLASIESGREIMVPGLGIQVQNLENPQLHAHLGLKRTQSGVFVTAVEYGGSAWEHLEVGDVITEIGGMPVANNGTVHYGARHRTQFDVALGDRYVGDDLEVVVWRKGEKRELNLELKPFLELVPRYRYDNLPSYFVYGGLVFQPLTRDFLMTWDSWWDEAPKELLYLYHRGQRTEKQREVVVLTQVLADEINVGYDELTEEAVIAVGGSKPVDLAHFVQLLEQSSGLVEIRTSTQRVILLDTTEVAGATGRIRDRYHLLKDRSEDLERGTR
jgi:S1-C subfamily serine protease